MDLVGKGVPPDSPDYAPPYLFVFLGGDYTVTDLTFRTVGPHPATDWSIFGIRQWLGHGLLSLAGPVMITGGATGKGYRTANATFQRVGVEGELSDDPLCGYNIYNGLFYEGFVGPELQPLKGTFRVSESTFHNVASATPALNLVNSYVSLNKNTIQNESNGNQFSVGSEIIDLRDTIYESAENRIEATYGIYMYDDCLGAQANCGTSESLVTLRNNQLKSTEGLWLDATLHRSWTLAWGNNFFAVSDTAVYLGEKTNHCIVVGVGSAKVINKGTDNIIIR